jgi:hypothetical protein
MPVSPATQRDVEATIRTAPVALLTQAATVVDTGAAIAAVPTRSEDRTTVRDLRDFIIDLLGESWGELPAFIYGVNGNRNTRQELFRP